MSYQIVCSPYLVYKHDGKTIKPVETKLIQDIPQVDVDYMNNIILEQTIKLEKIEKRMPTIMWMASFKNAYVAKQNAHLTKPLFLLLISRQ